MLTLLVALACTPKTEDDSAGPPSGPGTLTVSLQMDADYIPAMEANGEAPIGTFEGSVYAEADATSIGPNDGAASLEDFSIPGVDLSDGGGPTGPLWTSAPLDPQIVWVLGCLDVDGNGCGDDGDPITIPNENKVELLPGVDTPFTLYMGMLRP